VRLPEQDGGCADYGAGGDPEQHRRDEAGERGGDEDGACRRMPGGGEGGAGEGEGEYGDGEDSARARDDMERAASRPRRC
jgi:hypothetical protein